MVIFLHIPKTGGTTLRSSVLYHERKRGRIIAGDHYPYGVHLILDGMKVSHRKYQYITIMRDPVSRLRSQISYVQTGLDHYTDRAHRMIDLYKRDDMLAECYEKGWLCNLMTRQLSGLENPGDLDLLKGDFWKLRIYNPFSVGSLVEQDMDRLLEQAKKTVREMSFLMFTERLDRDIKKLCSKFEFNLPKRLPSKRKTSRKMELDEDLLKKMNEYDIELYNYARSIWW